MRTDKWFISNLDDTQRQIVVSDINRNIIVQGAAGSGKTNLAIHRAKQASLFSDRYAIVIYTIALKRMVATGMRALGLDDERIAYDWAWNHSGFLLNGNVFANKEDERIIYLIHDEKVRKFVRTRGYNNLRDAQKANPGTLAVGLDFADWVSDHDYYTYGRRTSIFLETELTKDEQEEGLDMDTVRPVTAAVLYKPAEEEMDYLIIDEVQDFSTSTLKNNYADKVKKTYAFFGDSAQMIYKNQGSTMDEIRKVMKGDPYFLSYNYRLPKSIAKVAQDIPEQSIDLMTHNMKDRGNSDYPYYPKPVVTKCKDSEAELEAIVNTIKNEDLDDVANLVPTEAEVIKVYEYLQSKGIDSQVHYRKRTGQYAGMTQVFRTVNTLDLANNDLPCILTYHAAKGTEFDNVFVPFANMGNLPDRKAFYVACTRSSHSLYISYSGALTQFMSKVKPEYIERVDLTKANSNNPF